MRIVALLCFLSVYVAPLQSSRNGKETCYYIVKVKTSRKDCSLMRRSVDAAKPDQPIKRSRRNFNWANPLGTPSAPTPPAPTDPSKITSSLPTPTPTCKTVIEKKSIRVLIYEKPMDPILSSFKSPDFPEVKPKKKLKCEWEVTGLSKKKYWVDVLKQFLTPSLSDTANCLWIRGKGSMCAGKVVPVLTKNNKLLMRMTLDSGQIDDIKGGLHGFYIEYDPRTSGGALPIASAREFSCGKNKTCSELLCNSTDPGPDLQQKPLSPVQSPVSVNTTATLNESTPTPKQSFPEKEKTDVPEYKKNADFIADLFKKFPLGGRKRRIVPEAPEPTQAALSTPTTASCIEPYEEDDRCDMDPPPPADDSEEDTYKRYFYNTNNGECQPIQVTDATLKGNIFENVTKCQRTCMNICLLPMDRGYGDISQTKFSFTDGSCRAFQYRGNGGNANCFTTKIQCERHCQAPSPDQFVMEAVKKILNNEASTDDYEDEKKVKCLLPHLRNSPTPSPTPTTTQCTPTTNFPQ